MGEKKLLYVPYLVTTPSLPTGDDTRRPSFVSFGPSYYYLSIHSLLLSSLASPSDAKKPARGNYGGQPCFFFLFSFFLRYTKLLRGGPGTKSIGHARHMGGA